MKKIGLCFAYRLAQRLMLAGCRAFECPTSRWHSDIRSVNSSSRKSNRRKNRIGLSSKHVLASSELTWSQSSTSEHAMLTCPLERSTTSEKSTPHPPIVGAPRISSERLCQESERAQRVRGNHAKSSFQTRLCGVRDKIES